MSLSDRLDAERQAKVDTAWSDARNKAKRLYYAKLSCLQSGTLEEAARDFESWRTTMLIPEWQVKEASAKAEKLQELKAFKLNISVELEEHKEHAHITAAKSLVHSKTDQRSHHQDCRANPIQASRSVSHVRSLSPSPSQKLDKTPTKADFQVSQASPAPLCAPVSDHAQGWAGPSIAQEVSTPVLPTHIVVPLAGPDFVKASVGILGDAESGLPLTPTSCLPEALPSAAPLETVSTNVPMDAMMAPATPAGDACPSSVRPVSGPDVTPAMPDSSLRAPLVDRYQSVTPSPTPVPAAETADDHMMHLLSLTITAALMPLKSSIDSICTCLQVVEDTQNWAPGDDDGFPADYDTSYVAPHYPPAEGEEHVDYHVASAPSRATAEDAEMEDARRCFKSHDDNEDLHPFFEETILAARNQSCTEMDPAQLATLANLAAEDWDDFCSRMFLDRLLVPPPPLIHDAFVTHTCVNLVKAQMEDDLTRALRADRGSAVPPSGPSFTGPHLSAQQDDPVALPHQSRLSEPISISSDGSKISGFTDSSPPPLAHPVGSALDLNTLPPGDGHSWSVMGSKCGQLFALIAATRPSAPAVPSPLPPSAAQAAHGFLTKPQLDSLTCEQVISAYNARFTPKLGLWVPKDRAVATFLDKASRPAPTVTPNVLKPITKTEFTLVYDTRAGDLSAPSGWRGDAASYVCAIQKHIRNAGTKQAELIGG